MDQANERHLKKIGKSRESSYCTYCTVLWFHVTRSLCISFCATDTTCSRCYGKLLRIIQPVLKASQHCLSHPNLSCKESYPTNKGPHKFLETRNSFPDVVLTFCKASKHRFPHLLTGLQEKRCWVGTTFAKKQLLNYSPSMQQHFYFPALLGSRTRKLSS